MSVIKFPPQPGIPVPADDLLESAKGKMTEALVAGWNEDGDLVIYSTHAKLSDVHWLWSNVEWEIQDHMNRRIEEEPHE